MRTFLILAISAVVVGVSITVGLIIATKRPSRRWRARHRDRLPSGSFTQVSTEVLRPGDRICSIMGLLPPIVAVSPGTSSVPRLLSVWLKGYQGALSYEATAQVRIWRPARPNQAALRQALIESLPFQLDFSELVAGLASLRAEWVNAMRSRQDPASIARQYLQKAEDHIDQWRQNREQGQIALIIQTAVIRRQGGDKAAYLRDLEQALTYAENRGVELVIEPLRAEIQAHKMAIGSRLRG